VSRPPLEWGSVTIAGDRIVAVEPHGLRRADLDLGDVAVLPGLVNAHTHLDLTGLRGRCPPSPDFTAWLRAVISHRRAQAPAQVEADVRAGLAESLSRGTTLLGDIAAGGLSWPILVNGPGRAVVFHELLGLPRARAEQSLAAARDWLGARPATADCRPGLSPHAPYSVRSTLFAQAALLANQYRCPLAVHLAESQDELDLLHQHRGPFVAFLQELGVWDPEGLAESPARVMQLCDQPVPGLFVHANYLAPSAGVPRHRTVVYCPRTHAAFGHPPHPFQALLARGVRVALGTDSLASNPDLDLLAEARFLHRLYPDFPGERLLHLATLAGAEALGWADQVGSLEPGKSADLVTVPLRAEPAWQVASGLPPAEPAPQERSELRSRAGSAEPHELVLASDRPVGRVLWRGRWIRGSPE
jgi:cytosine/adenosine deaminase-related metal-dependent hydrolase